MRKENTIIICLILCLGFIVGCLPDSERNLNNNIPVPTIPLENEAEIELEETITMTPLALPTSTPTTIPPQIPTISIPTEMPTQLPTGELYIFSEPEGALALIVSENLKTKTPAVWNMLSGTYTITLSLDGYQDWIMPITITAGSQMTLTVTLHQNHTLIPIEELTGPLWHVEWANDGQSLLYALSDEQWPYHVRLLPVYQSWWRYDMASGVKELVSSPQTRVTNSARESLGICPFPLTEVPPYPCLPNLQESPTSNRIAFSSLLVGHDLNTWLANVDGTEAIYLEAIPESPSEVMWSNNGQWMLIGVYAAIDNSNVYYLVSSDGTFVESLEELTNTNHWRVQGVRPQFSPDGQKMAFVGIETGNRDNEEAYNLYVLNLNTLKYQLVSMRFGSFQWSADGNGLYILDGAANTVGNSNRRGLQYANFYYIDLTQEGYPEQKLVGAIPISIPYTGFWAYSPEARAIAGEFVIDDQGSVFSLLFLP